MSLSRGNLKMALASVRNTRWRSLLTMLGVIIGIVSVVTVVAIGQGVKQQLGQQIDQFGKDLITVRPGRVGASSNKSITNTDLLFGMNSIAGLNEKDLLTIQKAKHVKLAAPLSVVSGTVEVDGHKLQNGLVVATNDQLPGALHREVEYGDFLKPRDVTTEEQSAVIGVNVAKTLFDGDVPLGQHFLFRGQEFIVRGIFGTFDGTPLLPASNFNDAIFIDYKVAEQLTGNSAQMYSILVKPDDSGSVKQAVSSIEKALQSAHGGEQDFSVLDRKRAMDASGSVLNLLTTMIVATAAISLLVGGIGIMNIMLVSVTERMHEIGVRKAIGATNRQILMQFMLEAVALSTVGGFVGIIVSVAISALLNTYTSLKPVITWQPIVIATGVSIAIGVISGVLPAAKAARKDPIEALRHE